MASTTTNLINTIDTGFPVAGQNNDSQGFRTNFGIIQSALLNTEAAIETIQATLGTSGGQTVNINTNYVTGTHVTALSDLNVGGTNIITTGSNFSTIISANGGAGNIAMSVNTASTIILDYQADNATTATSIFLLSTVNILVGATFTIGTTNYTITSINHSSFCFYFSFFVVLCCSCFAKSEDIECRVSSHVFTVSISCIYLFHFILDLVYNLSHFYFWLL
jgi:hypothetical protein